MAIKSDSNKYDMPTNKNLKLLLYHFNDYLVGSGKVKYKLRITSSNPRVMSSNSRVTTSNPQVKSSNTRVASSNPRVMSSN